MIWLAFFFTTINVVCTGYSVYIYYKRKAEEKTRIQKAKPNLTVH